MMEVIRCSAAIERGGRGWLYCLFRKTLPLSQATGLISFVVINLQFPLWLLIFINSSLIKLTLILTSLIMS